MLFSMVKTAKKWVRAIINIRFRVNGLAFIPICYLIGPTCSGKDAHHGFIPKMTLPNDGSETFFFANPTLFDCFRLISLQKNHGSSPVTMSYKGHRLSRNRSRLYAQNQIRFCWFFFGKKWGTQRDLTFLSSKQS